MAEAAALDVAGIDFDVVGAPGDVEGSSPLVEEDLAGRGFGLVASLEGCFT